MIGKSNHPKRGYRYPTYRYPAILFFVVLVLMAVGSPGFGQGPEITPEEARNHIGENRTVCGKVANSYYGDEFADRPTFLNLDEPWPHNIFTIVIMGRDRNKFAFAPESHYRNKRICVSGLITKRCVSESATRHRDLPHVYVDDPSRIEERL